MEDFPKNLDWLLKKHPELAEITVAIKEFVAGNSVAIRCPTCHALLNVSVLQEIGSLWVTCPNGHIRYHEKFEPGSFGLHRR